ncbi:hypothetical protein A946_09895 [Methylacidiphilum kamchatkense Kam1]|uniref:RDD family protein n=1 Tax=Methylacidiphilum kamchatkense Kam1 TaxID=1202785 RepID=A0A0C1V2R1_9BACT|nr:hypothetical protein A946_09895 [Methylacidiphilum kamchatkense Kam1]QDQ42386.1 hypothetical protein kam1_1158 [Methylacidiphilum kamchatkense Kam1]
MEKNYILSNKSDKCSLFQRWLISGFELALLFSLCAKIFNRLTLLFVFPFCYFCWCVFWEWKIQSRPFHWIMGQRIITENKMDLKRAVYRGLLRLFFPFIFLGFSKVSLLDLLSRCRWSKKRLILKTDSCLKDASKMIHAFFLCSKLFCSLWEKWLMTFLSAISCFISRHRPCKPQDSQPPSS